MPGQNKYRRTAKLGATVSARAADLLKIPNVGPAVAGDLLRLGIGSLAQMKGQDADALYERLCVIDQARHDPCLRDVFAAIIDHAAGRPARPWWHFTPARKARDARRDAASRSTRSRSKR